LENGWTQPIVARRSGEIVDGFHRWTLGKTDYQIIDLTDGLVPVVFLDDSTDLATQKLATVRHNRARGQHGILKMGAIVRSLLDEGLSKEQVMERLQMEEEEFDRLAETKGAPDRIGKDSFGQGWVPDAPEQTRPAFKEAPSAGRSGPQDAPDGSTPANRTPNGNRTPSKPLKTSKNRTPGNPPGRGRGKR
jgi:ParB-like chromosome segregation protein Spo0J